MNETCPLTRFLGGGVHSWQLNEIADTKMEEMGSTLETKRVGNYSIGKYEHLPRFAQQFSGLFDIRAVITHHCDHFAMIKSDEFDVVHDFVSNIVRRRSVRDFNNAKEGFLNSEIFGAVVNR
jgi:hypothetical protein